jgi:hypothetical protein
MTDGTMTTQEALSYIAEYFNVTSLYALSKALSDSELNVQPIQLSKYKKGHKMSKKVAQRFFDVYGVIINDFHDRGVFANGLDC